TLAQGLRQLGRAAVLEAEHQAAGRAPVNGCRSGGIQARLIQGKGTWLAGTMGRRERAAPAGRRGHMRELPAASRAQQGRASPAAAAQTPTTQALASEQPVPPGGETRLKSPQPVQ